MQINDRFLFPNCAVDFFRLCAVLCRLNCIVRIKIFRGGVFFSYNSCLRDLVAFLEQVDRGCLCSIFVLRLAWCCLVAFLFGRNLVAAFCLLWWFRLSAASFWFLCDFVISVYLEILSNFYTKLKLSINYSVLSKFGRSFL